MQEWLFKVPGFQARLLQHDDGAELQKLCEGAEDYYQMSAGLPPGPAEAQSLFTGLPEGKAYSDKFLIGVWSDETGELVGVIDAIKDYRSPGEWMLGLILLRPDVRGKGAGTRIYNAFERWAGTRGAQSIRIGVLQYNEGAYRFWKRAGFAVSETRTPYHFGQRSGTLYVMCKVVPAFQRVMAN